MWVFWMPWWSRVATSTCFPCPWHTVMCTCDIYSLCTLQFKDCLGHALIDSQHEVRLPEVSDYYYTDTDTTPSWTSKHGLVLSQKAILSWVITITPTPQIPHAVPILPPPPSMHIVDWFGRLFYHWCHPAVQSTEHAGSPVHHWGGWDAHQALRLFSRPELFIHMYQGHLFWEGLTLWIMGEANCLQSVYAVWCYLYISD